MSATSPAGSIPDPIAAGLARGWNVIDASRVERDLVLEADVAIVGTGAGGGTAADLLSAAGLSVLLLEEGPLRSSRDFDLREATAYPQLYQESAARKTKDHAITILQGRCVGGGTTVNWTSSFRTPPATLDHWARALGIRSIAVDLVYGLPHQSVDSFRRTVQTVADLGVDRIAVYQFAYLPTRLKHQRAIDAAVLPDADMRVRLIHAATTTLSRAGYEAIGMDHFALADDELAQARRAGTLRRNFMGYTTRAGTDLLGLGASAISRIGRDFAQSAKAVPEYAAQIEQGCLPVVAGMELSEDDLARERVIQSIMCYGESELPRLSNGAVAQLSPRSWQELAELERDALVRREGSRVVVTPRGRYFLRNVAMAFDAYLDREEAAAQFSRTA
jgi:oxygen-independent coproporphyrinogen-3 oxidase